MPIPSLEEYKALRQEIDTTAHLIIQIFTISLSISVPLISGITFYVLNNFNNINNHQNFIYPYIFLSPIIIFLPCYFLITSQRKNFFICGTYIQVFFEKENELCWETALDKFRESYKEESLDPISGAYGVLIIICVSLFWYFLYIVSSLECQLLLALVITLVIILLFIRVDILYRKIPTKIRKEYFYKWQIIKDEMEERPNHNIEMKQKDINANL